jgi:hypothetical protein
MEPHHLQRPTLGSDDAISAVTGTTTHVENVKVEISYGLY